MKQDRRGGGDDGTAANVFKLTEGVEHRLDLTDRQALDTLWWAHERTGVSQRRWESESGWRGESKRGSFW